MLIAAGCGVLGVWLLVLLVRNRPITDPLLYAVGAVELLVIAQSVIGLVQIFDPPDRLSVPTYLGYLIGTPFLLPIAFLWAISEKGRAGLGVFLVAVLVVPVLVLRLQHIWAGHA